MWTFLNCRSGHSQIAPTSLKFFLTNCERNNSPFGKGGLGGFIGQLPDDSINQMSKYALMLHYNKHIKEHAQRLRSNFTHAEQKLWSRLRGKQILNIQFYRQKTIGNYIVDFYAAKAKLVIELDGSQHHEIFHAQRDAFRDHFLRSSSLSVLRFNNLEVLHNLEGVMKIILDEVSINV